MPQKCVKFSIKTIFIVKVWIRKIKARNFETEDELRSGRPIEVHCEQLNQIINHDINVFNTNYCIRAERFPKNHSYTLKCIKFNRWVPHKLTHQYKSKIKAACLPVWP